MALFGKKGFKEAIQEYAKDNEWEIGDIDNTDATIAFETDAGNQYTVYLHAEDDLLTFSLPSATVFEKEDELPGDVSTELLKRNAELATGFWAIEELEDGWGYVLYHDQKLVNQDYGVDLDAEALQAIIGEMIGEVEAFDESWEEE